jgi:hypothetical protein
MLSAFAYIISKNRLFILMMVVFAVLFSACRDHYNDNKIRLPCLPYSISTKKTSKRFNLDDFGRLDSKVYADIEYHRLPNPTDKPYLIIEGNTDIIDRISCEVVYSNSTNQNDLLIYYSKCIRNNRVVKIHLYCKELFRISAFEGSFLAVDTMRSNVGWLTLTSRGKAHIDVNCEVPELKIILREGIFTLNGIAQICSLNVTRITEERISPPIHSTNLRNLDCRVLELYVESGDDYIDRFKRTPIYVGSPDTIYYNIRDNKQLIYYQGSPVLISRNSPHFTLTHEQ